MSLKDKFRKITSEISARHDYMRGDKGILEQKYRKLKQKDRNNLNNVSNNKDYLV